MKEKEFNHRKERNFIEQKGTLEEKKLPEVTFFYFNCLNIPEKYEKKNEEWVLGNEKTVEQNIFLMEKEEGIIIHIFYTLKKFQETSREYILSSEKFYAKQIDILVIEKEESTSTSKYYRLEEYKKEILKAEIKEIAPKEVYWENHWQQRNYAMEWGSYKKWLPEQLVQLHDENKNFKIGDADLFVRTKPTLITRKKISNYSIRGLYITIYLPVHQYEVEISLYSLHHQQEMLVKRKKYNLIIL